MTAEVRILGIDPGSRATGFGVIDTDGRRSVYVQSGIIRARGEDFAARLKQIFAGAADVIATYDPGEMCIERVFVHRNADSALKLGHARAAAICASFSRELPIHEYTPREIKQAIAGSGGADKSQVEHMVKVLLSLQGPMQPDAADALAVALCHAHVRVGRAVLRAAELSSANT